MELEQLDRQVALQVLLLVDREQHLAGVDRLEHRRRQVEGAELDLVQHLDLLERRSVGSAAVGPSVRTPSVSGLAVRYALTALLTSVGSMVTASTSTGAPSRPSMKPSQRRSRATLPTSWLTQIALLTPGLLESLAAAEAGLVLGLADVRRDAELLEDVRARVHRDHRDVRGDRVPDRIAERLGVGDRDHEAVGLRGDRGVDDLRHLHHVEAVGRAVLDGHAEVLGGLVDAVLDHRPERVRGLAVADHDEAHVLGHAPRRSTPITAATTAALVNPSFMMLAPLAVLASA